MNYYPRYQVLIPGFLFGWILAFILVHLEMNSGGHLPFIVYGALGVALGPAFIIGLILFIPVLIFGDFFPILNEIPNQWIIYVGNGVFWGALFTLLEHFFRVRKSLTRN